ncbi:MAG: hypothetical protein FJY67_03645 [Calditrichaeota bacterium]|nr:hypothetical protein [Calditrichota bacterium]
MTAREFLNALTGGRRDILQDFLDMLDETGTPFCLIGGLAVNAYVEPVVSLDVDVVVEETSLEDIIDQARRREWKVDRFEHSINLSAVDSDLRIQLQVDPEYQKFIDQAVRRSVMGYEIPVAKVEDVLTAKIRAALDPGRRPGKRLKDLADIVRICESYPELERLLPDSIHSKLN